ncbi:MAG: lipopolysaccharide biosynthesis protein [Bacteroidetes bacterium]|nr:lipopolysaccharide biosynthesis protein [Bacteroidota bacterium]
MPKTSALSPPVTRLIAVLFARRRLIVGASLVAAIGSVIVSLFLPKYYLATARLLLPEQGSGNSLTNLLGDLAPTAATILGRGSGGGDFDRYRAILLSRTTNEKVVQHFGLIDVYELKDAKAPMTSALETLASNVEFAIDLETGYLGIEVLDRSPERAAEMANFYVNELNERNAELLAQSAREYRLFMSGMLSDTEARLDSARTALASFQERTGLVDLPTQVSAFYEGVASLRTEVLKAQIEFEATRQQLGPDSPQTRRFGAVFSAAQRRYEMALSGSEAVLPVALDSVAQVAKTYTELSQEVLVQTELFKFVRPLYEQAMFDEQRTRTAVQVLDRAAVPELKAKPKRSLFVISVTLSIFALACLYSVVLYWYQRNWNELWRLIRSPEE